MSEKQEQEVEKKEKRVVLLKILALVVTLTILEGTLLSLMWKWFMVPLGVPPIGIAHAYGIWSVVSMVRYRHHGEDFDLDKAQKALTSVMYGWAICFICAWIAHKIMAW